MQTVSSQFHRRATADFRRPSARLLISFDKEYDDTTDFFTLDSSNLDSTDILAGTNDVIQEWNKYHYHDYSSRMKSVEWTRELGDPYSIGQAFADIVLDNSDDFFTPGAGSEIDGFILPNRPVRIFAGFSGEYVQVFVGLTQGKPQRNDRDKTVKIHCVDYLSSIYKKPLTDATSYQNMRVDEIIDELLQIAGLVPEQYVLDEAYNTVDVAFFKKNMKLGDALDLLVQSDLGTLMMDENGVIRYINRQNYSDTPVASFTESEIFDRETSDERDIINVVEVEAELREPAEVDKVYGLTKAQLIEPGQSREIIAEFNDPVISIVTPVHIVDAVAESSIFNTNTAEDSSGSQNASDITLSSTQLSSTQYKMVFENTGSQNMYITSIQLWGVIAPVTNTLTLREETQASVDKYGEKIYEIKNPYIQNESLARSLQLILLSQRSEDGDIEEVTVWGNPALQLNDTIELTPYSGDDELYFITRQENEISHKAGFKQVLTVAKRQVLSIFTLDSSYLDGPDVLGAN